MDVEYFDWGERVHGEGTDECFDWGERVHGEGTDDFFNDSRLRI